ncbi:MAG: D-alanine--D-alanine ligase [Rhodospirillales bacterium]|nr:D-alanine--D-alanine ligase [Rhodospirillales bacterium]
MTSKHVAVLMGGWSAEREVSLVTGASVCKALTTAGYRVTPIDVQRDAGVLLTRLFPRPDVVFNGLHGRYGEDGCIQGLLELLGIPYTHSGLLASALAMDKVMAKRVFSAAGLKVAEDVIASREEILAGDIMPRPYVIKPINEGSSVGVHIAREGDNASPLDPEGWTFGANAMVERYIAGRELTVAVMGDRPLGVTEITTSRGFYDYDAKYADGGSIHVIPAEISDAMSQKAMAAAVIAHQSLGCRGITRADFRYDESEGEEGLYILEVNTQPGLTPTSLVPEQAAYAGISFAELAAWMVENAQCDG